MRAFDVYLSPRRLSEPGFERFLLGHRWLHGFCQTGKLVREEEPQQVEEASSKAWGVIKNKEPANPKDERKYPSLAKSVTCTESPSRFFFFFWGGVGGNEVAKTCFFNCCCSVGLASFF